ncbi:hypothetical protein H4R19_005535, partial [Coemansia spiralis]
DTRTLYRLQARLRRLLAREHGTASDEAVALEGIQGAVARLASSPLGAHAALLAAAVGPLVLDAARSARVWALCHPATLAAEQARVLEAQLTAALAGDLPPETRTAAVEAHALLYAAAARRSGDRIVEAVAYFAQSLPPAAPRLAASPAAAPADVLADVARLAAWRAVLQLTALAGCLPDQGERRHQVLEALCQQTTRTAGEQWPMLRLRLSWAVHANASRAELLSLLADMAFAWCGAARDEALGALVADPAHRLGRAVATELAWRGAAHLQSPLAEQDRRAAESRALCRATAGFQVPPAPTAAQLSVAVALLLAVATACGVADPDLAAATEHLVTCLATADAAWPAGLAGAAAGWRSALLGAAADASDVLASAVDAVHSALAEGAAEQRAELACVALAEAAVCLLAASVPERPVDPAAKAHTRWAWLGEDAAEARADADAHDAVHRSMAGAHAGSSAAAAPFALAACELERQRSQIALVHRPADARFGELWREAHTLAQTLGPRARDIACRLRDAGEATAAALDAACGAEQALRTTLAQFEHRVATRHFAALRDMAQLWCLCARLVAHSLAGLAELCRRRAARAQLARHAALAQTLYAQPMCVGVLASPESNACIRHALDQLKVLIYTTSGSDPAPSYAELLGALLARIVLGVQVHGTLGPDDLAALDTVFSDAYATHRR